MKKLSEKGLVEICSNYKKVHYDVFDYDANEYKHRLKTDNIKQILPKDIYEIHIFDPMGLMTDINIYSNIKNNNLNTGKLIRILLHIADLRC